MLQLSNLSLTHFRNHINNQFNFNTKIIGICGKNGTGKTNLLDAIYYLSFTKSYFNRSDNSNVSHKLEGFRITATVNLNQNSNSVTCILRENGKKELLWNNDEYDKLSKHIGVMPSVIIAPDDTELISGGSELRRRFIDMLLSQINPNYLQHLIKYNNLLQQRNSLIKQQSLGLQYDDALLTILSEQLAFVGTEIYNFRNDFLIAFLPKIVSNYEMITQNTTEKLCCNYSSQLHNTNFKQLLAKNLQTDFALQRTTSGIHKDDIDFYLNDVKFKSEASQGQRKSLLFALKLTEWQILKQKKGFYPILLLDDVFEKLDNNRMQNLLETVSKENECQIFITDTHKERLEQQLQLLNCSFKIVDLDNLQ